MADVAIANQGTRIIKVTGGTNTGTVTGPVWIQAASFEISSGTGANITSSWSVNGVAAAVVLNLWGPSGQAASRDLQFPQGLYVTGDIVITQASGVLTLYVQ